MYIANGLLPLLIVILRRKHCDIGVGGSSGLSAKKASPWWRLEPLQLLFGGNLGRQ